MLNHFDYQRPVTLDEAVKLLTQPGAKAMAGGTDLIVSIRSGMQATGTIVDIKGIKELKGIKQSGGELEIGALTTINELIDSREIREWFPILIEAGNVLASHQVRNRATVAGNLCNASPAADMAPPLLVLDARAVIYGGSGKIEMPLIELFAGVKRTSLRDDEILVSLKVPLQKGRGIYVKKARIKGPDLSTVVMACFISGQILRVAVGACAPVPKTFETDISGMNVEDIVYQVKETVSGIISPIDDVRASAEYRKALVYVYIERMLREALSGREGEV